MTTPLNTQGLIYYESKNKMEVSCGRIISDSTDLLSYIYQVVDYM